MGEIQSLLTAGAILAASGLGLFLYKSDENENEKEEDQPAFVEDNKTDEETREIYDGNKPKKAKTRKSRKRGGGGTRRSTSPF